MKTHVILDFVLEHEGDGIIGSFDMLAFIEAGVRAAEMKDVTAILPGSKLTVKVVSPSRLKDAGIGRILPPHDD